MECANHGAVSWVHAFSNDVMYYGKVRTKAPIMPSTDISTGSSIFDKKILIKQCDYPVWTWFENGLRFKVVVHLVRNPIQSISSRSQLNDKSIRWLTNYVDCVTAIAPTKGVFKQRKGNTWETVARSLARLEVRTEVYNTSLAFDVAQLSDAKLILSLRHFVSWNGFVEKIASHRFKVEDISYDRYKLDIINDLILCSIILDLSVLFYLICDE